MKQTEAATLYGIFSGKSIVLRNIPVALASAMSAAIVPTIASSWIIKDKKSARDKVAKSGQGYDDRGYTVYGRTCSLITSCCNTDVPAESINRDIIGTVILLAPTVMFYCISTITNGVLQSIGYANKPVVHAGIALLIQSVLLDVLLRYTDLNLFALVAADLVYSFLMCNERGSSKKAYGLSSGIYWHIHKTNTVFTCYGRSCLCCVCEPLQAYKDQFDIARSGYGSSDACISLHIILAAGVISESELKSLPKVVAIASFARKLRFIR